MRVELIEGSKKGFLPLLLLGDEEEGQIDKYLEKELRELVGGSA